MPHECGLILITPHGAVPLEPEVRMGAEGAGWFGTHDLLSEATPGWQDDVNAALRRTGPASQIEDGPTTRRTRAILARPAPASRPSAPRAPAAATGLPARNPVTAPPAATTVPFSVVATEPVTDGVGRRSGRWTTDDGPQVVELLDVDPAATGISLEASGPAAGVNAVATVRSQAGRVSRDGHRVVAAINGDTLPPMRRPVSGTREDCTFTAASSSPDPRRGGPPWASAARSLHAWATSRSRPR